MKEVPHNKETSGFLNENNVFQEIERLTYVGGTSECYKVRIDGEYFFMKRLLPEYANDPKFHLIIEKEYKIGSSIDSRYTPRYISINRTEECTYILTEYINGTNIEEILDSTPRYFRCRKNLYKFVTQLLEGVQAMHSKRIVHLDLTPQNIMLTNIGNNVKIVDLGFCVNDSYLHTAGTTPAFAAPELKECRFNDIDERTDIYTIGTMLQHIEKRSGKKLPHTLQKIKRKCLQQEKAKRYASASEILGIIEHRTRRALLKLAAGLAIAAALLAAYAASGLHTTLNDCIGWQCDKFPARFEADGVFYNITDNERRTVEVTYKGNYPDEFEYEYAGNEVHIPQTVTYHGRTFTVTAIAGEAFKNPYINKINIPDGIVSIGKEAFKHCSLSGVVHIPGSVKSIGEAAFYPTLYVEGFVVDSTNTIYDSRGGCNALIETATNTLLYGGKQTVIPGSVTSIAAKSFSGVAFETIAIPQSVTSIGEAAFVHSGLSGIHLPDGITVLNDYCFQWCEELSHITLPVNLKEIRLAALSHCKFTELTIPDSVVFIGEYAFDYNERLKKVVIGKGVRHIGDFAFDGCSRLNNVISHIPAEELFEVSDNVFGNIGNDCVLYVPKGAKRVYANTIGWDKFTQIIEM